MGSKYLVHAVLASILVDRSDDCGHPTRDWCPILHGTVSTENAGVLEVASGIIRAYKGL